MHQLFYIGLFFFFMVFEVSFVIFKALPNINMIRTYKFFMSCG